MGKYDPLFSYLHSCGKQQVTLQFSGIEAILSDKLPKSAYQYPAWWENHERSHVQSRAWLRAGYKVESVVLGDRVTFVRE